MDKSTKQMVLIGGLCLALMILWIVGFYLPTLQEVGVLEKRLATLRAKEQQKISEGANRTMQSVVDNLRILVDEQERRLLPTEKLLDVGRAIEGVGKQYGLRLVSVTPDYESLSVIMEQKAFCELPITTEFRGTFQEFTRFMDGLPDFPFALRVHGVSLLKESQSRTELKIELQGVIVLRKEETLERSNENQGVRNRT